MQHRGINPCGVVRLVHALALHRAWQSIFGKQKALYSNILVSWRTQDKGARSQRIGDAFEPTFYNFMLEVLF